MILESAAVGPFFKNGFVLGCERTRQAVFIDPGDEVEQLLAFIREEQLAVTHILLTHAHVDHVSGVAAAKRQLGVPIHLHKDDLFLYQNAVRSYFDDLATFMAGQRDKLATGLREVGSDVLDGSVAHRLQSLADSI